VIYCIVYVLSLFALFFIVHIHNTHTKFDLTLLFPPKKWNRQGDCTQLATLFFFPSANFLVVNKIELLIMVMQQNVK